MDHVGQLFLFISLESISVIFTHQIWVCIYLQVHAFRCQSGNIQSGVRFCGIVPADGPALLITMISTDMEMAMFGTRLCKYSWRVRLVLNHVLGMRITHIRSNKMLDTHFRVRRIFVYYDRIYWRMRRGDVSSELVAFFCINKRFVSPNSIKISSEAIWGEQFIFFAGSKWQLLKYTSRPCHMKGM